MARPQVCRLEFQQVEKEYMEKYRARIAYTPGAIIAQDKSYKSA